MIDSKWANLSLDYETYKSIAYCNSTKVFVDTHDTDTVQILVVRLSHSTTLRKN